jgi:hypothetical protein
MAQRVIRRRLKAEACVQFEGYLLDKMWHCNTFLSQYFSYKLSVFFRKNFVLIFI